MDLSFLPLVNASLNGVAVVLLVAGLVLVRRGHRQAHRRAMLGAFLVSVVFLVSYVTHYVWRAQVAGGTHTRYGGEGLMALFYYVMLLSHVLLAMAVPFLVVWMIRLGLTGRYDVHRRVGRFAYPIWIYVSITGVLIYVMLYPLNPTA